MKEKHLGRGLAALLGDDPIPNKDKSLEYEIQVVDIRPFKSQPRSVFDPEKMETLVNSIRARGVLQPLIVRKKETYYELIAGERRWRAAKEINLKTVPVVILECNDEEAIKIGLIENLQRDDLNPIEEAESFEKLIIDHNKTQEEIAASISKSRSHVANTLRLNALPPFVKDLLLKNKITAGHGKVLVNCENIEAVVNEILKKKLSVRETERLVKKQPLLPEKENNNKIPDDTKILAERIGRLLGLKTDLLITKNKKSLVFYFDYLEQLDDLILRLEKLKLQE